MASGAVGFANALGDGFAHRLAHFLGSGMYYLDSVDRRIILQNLQRIFGSEMSLETRRNFARNVCRNLSVSAMEAIRLRSKSSDEIKRMADDAGFEARVLDAFKRQRSIMIVTAHYGNWELFAARVALMGPLTVLARKNPNSRIERVIQDIRDRNNVRVIDRSDPTAPREMIRMGREGGHIIGILMDQDTVRIQSIYSKFMGHTALTPSGPASIAIRDLYDIYIGVLRPTGSNNHRFVMHGPVDIPPVKNRSDGVEKLTGIFNEHLSEIILEAPEYWVWNHRRWRHQPDPDREGAR